MKRRMVLAAGLALPAVTRAQAQDYPGRPVSMVVAFPPGGQADVVARPVAAGLERLWHQPVPVVNRAGAAGEIGNAFVARAAPDGLTLLMALSSLAILPEAARLLGRPPAYELDQLTPVALFTADPTILVVPAAAPWRTLEGIPRRCEAPAGGDQLFLLRQLLGAACADGDADHGGRGRSAACALPGRWAGADRVARRPGAGAGLRPAARSRRISGTAGCGRWRAGAHGDWPATTRCRP